MEASPVYVRTLDRCPFEACSAVHIWDLSMRAMHIWDLSIRCGPHFIATPEFKFYNLLQFLVMINRLLSGSFAAASSSSVTGASRNARQPSAPAIKHSAAAMIIPFKLNIKDFEGCDGSTIMMECRIFNDTILDVRQCCNCLTRIFYLCFGNAAFKGKTANDPKLSTIGISLLINETQATSIFFCITKAFQSKDVLHLWVLTLVILETAFIFGH